MTNADCIRQMTDEELFRFIVAVSEGEIDFAKTFCDLCSKNCESTDCDSCVKWWLTIDCEKHPQGIKH